MNAFVHRPALLWLVATIVALAAASFALLAYAPAASAAASQRDLVVQSVDTSAFPEVSLTVALPGEMLDAPKPSFAIVENSAPIASVTAKALGSEQVQAASVILVIDVSGSMRGQPLADAKTAARTFIGRMRPGDSIALVAFSAEPRLAASFTDDRATLLGAIEGLSAGGETALYDAVSLSSRTFASAPAGQRAIVLLSDGGDTVSESGLDQALRSVRSGKTPVYAVALQSPEADFKGLQAITRESGGRYLAASQSAGLEPIYTGIARELQTQYRLTYVSAKPQTKDVVVDITARSAGKVVRGWTVFDNPALDLAAPAYRFTVPAISGTAAVALLAAFFGIAFVAAALFAFGVLGVVLPERTSLGQLEFYDQIRGSRESAKESQSALQARVMDAVGAVAGRRGFTQLVTARLERAGLPLRPVEYIVFHLLAVVGLGVVVALAGGGPFGGLIVVLLATFIPIYGLDVAGRHRQRKFDEQLPDILNLISGSLRAGYGLLQSVGLIVQEVKKPASDEFKRVQTEARLGLPLEDALDKMAERLGSADFRWAVMAMNIQREVGGNLAEILDIVAKTVREREELRSHVRTLTEESRLSAVILGILPFFIALVLFLTSPRYILGLVVEPLGRGLILLALMVLGVGIIWLRRVMTIEV